MTTPNQSRSSSPAQEGQPGDGGIPSPDVSLEAVENVSADAFFYGQPEGEEEFEARRRTAERLLNSDGFDQLPDEVRANIQMIHEMPGTYLTKLAPEEYTQWNPDYPSDVESADEHEELQLLPEVLPTSPEDYDARVDVAYYSWGWDKYGSRWGVQKDFGLAANSDEQVASRVKMPRPVDDMSMLRFSTLKDGTPAIAYSFSPRKPIGVDAGDRGYLAGVAVIGDGLTPELALRLVDPEQDGSLSGWCPGEDGPLDPHNNEVSLTNVATIKDYQYRDGDQRERVYKRLEDEDLQNRLVSMVSAALDNPVGKPGARYNLYMPDVSERDAHAMLFCMLDMFSGVPAIREVIGDRWTFATNVFNRERAEQDGDKNVGLRFMFSAPEKNPPPSSIQKVRPLKSYEGTTPQAAKKLVETFLGSDHNPNETARLAAAAGEFDPQNTEAWCERLVAA